MVTVEGTETSVRGHHQEQPPPAIASGVELIGRYEGSGFKEPPSLARRADGQIIQLPPLLYELLRAIDGHRAFEELGLMVSERVQRRLKAADVRFLIEERLRPQGLVAAADGTSPRLRRPDPFLAFRYRIGVVPEGASGALGATFKPLFVTPVVIVLLGCFVAADWWLFFHHGVAQALRQAIYHPGLFLPLLAAIVVSAAFHEIGHASACRYGGARPGPMGCGLYLAWPAFYTDVSDAYRLDRRGRLRTDLGGVYFNVVIILAATGIYLVTRNVEALLLLAVIEHTEIAHQLLPVIRLDGYYVVADLTGVPDLFARIGPILRSVMFWRGTDRKVTVLKRWVRVAVTAWVFIVVPLLVLELLIVLIHLPRILATSWDSADQLARHAGRAFGNGRTLDGFSDTVQILVLAIPTVAILLMVGQLLRKTSSWAWRTTRRRPLRRGAVLAAGAGCCALLALAWFPRHNYQPIKPGEKGTQGEGLHALLSLAGGPGPLYSEQAAAPPAVARRGASTPEVPPSPLASIPVGPSPQPGGTGAQAPPATPPVAPRLPSPPLLPTPTIPLPQLPSPTLPPVTLPPVTVPPLTVPPPTLPRITVPPPTVPPPTLPR
jgi:putative peptide zinc metalloprotease protein